MCHFALMRWTPQYHTACKIQNKITAMLDAPDMAAKDLASLVGAWEKLEERKRILRMKPLPKAIDVPQKAKLARPATFSE